MSEDITRVRSDAEVLYSKMEALEQDFRQLASIHKELIERIDELERVLYGNPLAVEYRDRNKATEYDNEEEDC